MDTTWEVLFQVDVSADVVFDVTPNDTLVITGDNTQLNCSFEDDGVPDTVVWHYGRYLVTKNRDIVNDRFDYNITGEGTEYNLRIYDVVKEQESEYSCGDEIYSDYRYYAFLYVIDAPNVNITSHTMSTVIEGENFIAICEIVKVGNPTEITRFYWTGPEDDIVGYNNTLLLTNINRSEPGIYTCIATNTYYDDTEGNGTATVRVDVQHPPVVNVSDLTSCVIKGRSYKLECRADGNPVPVVFWVTPKKQEINEQTLLLNNIARHDNGEYICNATNVFWDNSSASDTETILIEIIQYAPDVEVSISGDAHGDGRVREGDSFVMLCNVTDAYPEDDIITWTTSDGDVLENETITFDKVTRGEHGRYMCSAYNTLCDQTQGNGSTVILVDVQYSPSVTVTDETGFNVVEGNSYFAVCEVDSNPDSAITWLYPDGTETNGHQLEITNTNRNDAGIYTCTAITTFWDGSSASDSGTMDLNVEYEGIVTLVGSEKEIDESESVNFTCTVGDSNPNPFRLELTLDGQVLEYVEDHQGITHLEYTISVSTDEDA
ncbi:cell adhesion molecule CEACAM5-like, partial [Saccoglossus kowalevskii]